MGMKVVQMEFFRWKSWQTDGICVLAPLDIDRVWELHEGISRRNDFPENVFCKMSPMFPKDVQLSDNLYGAGVPVVSYRVKEILEKEVAGSNRIEYLPVKIRNHKGRVASNDYFILNTLDVCDCIDFEKSGVVWNKIDPNFISRCKGLVIRSENIPASYKIFRLQYWGSVVLVRSDLVESLKATELTGLVFLPATGFMGM